MPNPISRRMRAEDRRAQIVDVTKELVGEHGLHSVSIEAVARRAGVSRPVVYEHFGDLNGLIEALLDRISEQAMEQLGAVLPPALGDGPPREALLAALRSYLEAAQADPVTWRLVLMPPEGAPVLARERIARGRVEVVARLAHAIGPGFISGRGSPDPELTARVLSVVADEAVRLVLTVPEEFPVERILTHARWLLEQFDPPPPRARA